jgi:hypothetical protein
VAYFVSPVDDSRNVELTPNCLDGSVATGETFAIEVDGTFGFILLVSFEEHIQRFEKT